MLGVLAVPVGVNAEDDADAETSSPEAVDAVIEEHVHDGSEESPAEIDLDMLVPVGEIGSVGISVMELAPAAGGTVVIALDAGHDTTHKGANYNGLAEENITWQVRDVTAAELAKYANVKIIKTGATSGTGACPYPGSTSSECMYANMEYAKAQGANYFISFHFNATGTGSARGSLVIVPSTGGNYDIFLKGNQLGNAILTQLNKLGFANRGTMTRVFQGSELEGPDDYYADGSAKDYYANVRWPKENGITGIIIEHAFIDNAEDAGLVKQTGMLIKLGLADAAGIVNALGLQLLDPNAPTSTASVGASLINSENTIRVTANSVGYASGVKSLNIAVWGATNGQNDLRWYPLSATSSGNYTLDVPVSNHKETGTYYAHVYATLGSGASVFVGGGTVNVSGATATLSFKDVNAAAGTFKVQATGISSASGAKKIKIAVWTLENGQDDIYWYEQTLANGASAATVYANVANHKYSYGSFTAHAYVESGNGTLAFAGGASYTINAPAASISASLLNSENTIRIAASGVQRAPGISSVRFAVWGAASGQNDLVWYSRTASSAGSYVLDIPVSAHKETGIYYVHCYATLTNGQSVFMGGTAVTVSSPVATLSIPDSSVNAAGGTFDINVTGISSPSGAKKLKVAVWTNEGGQDDIYWYETTLAAGATTATIHANLARHGYNYGTFIAHAYIESGNGTLGYAGSTYKTIPAPTAVLLSDALPDAMTIRISLAGLQRAPGIKEVRFAVWGEAGGQNDLRWYSMPASASGSYLMDVSVLNHKETGVYYIHLYAVLTNGQSVFCGSALANVPAPTATVAVANANQYSGTFDVNVTNIASASGAKKLKLAVWTNANGQDDIRWYEQSVNAATSLVTFPINIKNHKYEYGTYTAHLYVESANGTVAYAGGTTYTLVDPGYAIMGTSTVTAAQMVRWYKSKNKTYPAALGQTGALGYNGGAPNIETFAQIVLEEAAAEGVKAEVVFAQCMQETGWLQYGGSVQVNQFNFAGIGATGAAGATSASFKTVREGVRAQVQHLKAYASTAPLNQTCVDPRFSLVTRGCAPFVQWLGKNENPYGYGWATAVGYGNKIVEMINELKQA
ncbi:MAG: GBS Bsp-like repeat-containing protein [Clostridiales Family XIII bacterium]|jgi:N-acetylmuramoyl-L-alanine amidase|nr:GBS Bsp-like repeat-containing protein [Clostridiales Family XIII bacterium]